MLTCLNSTQFPNTSCGIFSILLFSILNSSSSRHFERDCGIILSWLYFKPIFFTFLIFPSCDGSSLQTIQIMANLVDPIIYWTNKLLLTIINKFLNRTLVDYGLNLKWLAACNWITCRELWKYYYATHWAMRAASVRQSPVVNEKVYSATGQG